MAELFGAILNIHKDLDSQRNDVVHGVWGFSEDIKDIGVWSSQQDHARMIIEAYHSETTKPILDTVGHMTKDYSLYTYKDLEKLNRQIRALTHAIALFHSRLRYGSKPAGESAYRRLCAEPLIQRELERMRSSDRSKPPAPPK
jgi:hypothetical protein